MGDMTLETATQGFLLHCAAEGKSPATLAWYASILGTFGQWAGESTMLGDVAVEMVRQYLAWLREPRLLHPDHRQERRPKANTIRGHWATLSAFFGWCAAEGLTADNPMERVRAPKGTLSVIDTLSQAEVNRILDACLSKRDEALVRFLLDSLCRIQEAATLPLANLDLERGRAKVNGKGARERFVYFGKACRKALWLYVSVERPEPLPGTANDLVFLTHAGRPFADKSLTKHLQRLGKRAGVPRLHAHLLRHTGAIERLRNGQDVFTLQRLLGHSTLEMCHRYLRALKDEDAERASQASAPGDRWRL